LVAAGADALHVSIGTGWTGLDKVIEPMSTPEGWRLPYAKRIRAAVDVPVIGVGQIRWPDTAERALVEGDADLIALGRPLLADPEWPNKVRRGQIKAIRPCTSCNYCIAMHAGEHGHISCAENPRTGNELDAVPDAGRLRGQRAVVIGGGPGGMAAALMLQQAGFRTDLYEARPALGGGLIASAAPPFKEKLGWYQDYLEHQLRGSAVQVHLGQRADLATLGDDKPAITILANGAQAVQLPIQGIDSAVVLDAYRLLMGDPTDLPAPGVLPVAVYGGGETGCESAEYLSQRGYQVVLISRSPARELARSAEAVYRGVLCKRLAENPSIRIIDNTSIVGIDPDGTLSLRDAAGGGSALRVARLLVAQGRRPDAALMGQFIDAGIAVTAIGDARRGGRIGDAVNQAYAAVVTLCATAASASELAC
jgi:NADPH-dependent 2,4-dienoyl-CoA reductase/sulfur reductase-like enzyme